MKISKIVAGMSAMALAASMAISASAATVKPGLSDWKVPAQKGVVAFQDLDTATAWNGCWIQFYSTTKDLSGINVNFTVDTTNATWQTYEDEETGEVKGMNESGTYTIMRAGDTAIEDNTLNAAGFEDGNSIGKFECTNDNGVYTFTVPGSYLNDNIDNGIQVTEEEVKDDDGNVIATVYNVGFNVQFGHFDKATWNVDVVGDNAVGLVLDADGNLAVDTSALSATESTGGDTTDGNTNSTDSTTNSTTNSTDSTTSSTSSTTSSTSSTSSKAGTTSTAAKTTTSTTAVASTSTAASDNTSNAESGAAAGVGLAIAALAGAAIVVSRKK